MECGNVVYVYGAQHLLNYLEMGKHVIKMIRPPVLNGMLR